MNLFEILTGANMGEMLLTVHQPQGVYYLFSIFYAFWQCNLRLYYGVLILQSHYHFAHFQCFHSLFMFILLAKHVFAFYTLSSGS